jgi:hypothetical protein
MLQHSLNSFILALDSVAALCFLLELCDFAGVKVQLIVGGFGVDYYRQFNFDVTGLHDHK